MLEQFIHILSRFYFVVCRDKRSFKFIAAHSNLFPLDVGNEFVARFFPYCFSTGINTIMSNF